MERNPPKGEDLSARLSKLSAEKRALLEKRLRGNFAASAEAALIAPRQDRGPAPLSFAQERLWFLDQLFPNNPSYNIATAFRLTTPLDPAVLQRCLYEIAKRHEGLRTTFPTVDGVPRQVIAPTLTILLDVADLRTLPPEERENEALRLADEEAQHPFDLSRGPLVRARLLRLDTADFMLLLTMHHIVSDGWSMGIFCQELTVLYDAFSEGRESPLPALRIQYADYALWQRRWLTGAVLEEQLEYWKQQLAALPVLQMPIDRPRPAVRSFRGAHHPLTIPRSLAQGLNALSRSEGTTLFMTLLAAFMVLLYRYTGQTDLAVGTPVAGRTRREMEDLIGFFVNTFVLRVNLSGDLPFREVLARAREAALGAYEHQDVPFERIVEAMQPTRDPSRSPLFQVMFALQNAPGGTVALGQSSVRGRTLDTHTSKFDLSLSMAERGDSLAGLLEYNTDLFDTTTVVRFVSHYQTLLEGIVAHPERPVERLPLLTHADKEQVLVAWNRTAAAFPGDQCLHELVEAQAARTPEAEAVVCGDMRLSYGQLNERANRLAHYLQARGVGKEVLVGIYMERSLDLVVGLLGILKAGGAYVALDAAYPKERIAFMLTDARVPVLLTQERLLEGVPGHEAHVVCLDREWDAIAEQPGQNVPLAYRPDQLAYVIYTSGSTGIPKGIAIEHRSPVALLSWARSVFEDEDLAGVLASTSVCFDLSIFELFLPLSVGGTVILIENALHLPQLPVSVPVTLINTVPSVMKEVLRLGELPSSVRVVNLAGEPLSAQLVDELYERGVERVYDLYGPSETTTYSTYALRKPNGPVTIGRPIANTQVYILDGLMEPVPIGVVGELYIGGEGMARGYLHRPALTAEKFVTNPFGQGLLYRTGDHARWTTNGDLEFLGRVDHQVKLRGFRIELGEIEAVMSQASGVREAVAMVREDDRDQKQLVAYVVTDEVSAVTDLRDYLRAQLPEYMVPSAFVFLETLPLTPNGKVDRNALPAPDPSLRNAQVEFVAPRTAAELLIAEVWQKLLGVERAGVHDNFIDLGGHSLLAPQVTAKLEKELGVRLNPGHLLFETLGQCAARCEKHRSRLDEEQGSRTPAEKPLGRIRGAVRRLKNAMLARML